MKSSRVGGPARTERKPYSLGNRNKCGEKSAVEMLGGFKMLPTPYYSGQET